MDRHDVIVLGAGPAGLTAGLYAGRARLETLVLEMMVPGGWAAITQTIENYPGAGTVNGQELVAAMVEQAKAAGAEIASGQVDGLEQAGDGFVVRAGEKTRETRSVIVATGTEFRKLGIPGEERLAGRGVSYCATCDGPLYKGLEIAVVGGGDSALQEALYLTGFASKVYLIHRRDEFRGVELLSERIRSHEKIECLLSTTVQEVNGDDGVESLEIRDVSSGETRSLPVAGVFVFIGLEPRTGFLSGLVETDEQGFIVTDGAMRTGVRGLLAAGDCRAKLLRQVSTAVGDGATAAFAAQRYLEDGQWPE